MNLRAEGDPERLRAMLLGSLDDAARAVGATSHVASEAFFRPSRPVPTHRTEAT